MSRSYLTRSELEAVATQLSARDEAVLLAVTRLRFMSGRQLERLCFSQPDADTVATARAARRSLLRLTELGLLDRLERRVGGVRRGSAGFVYYLAPWGQRLAVLCGWLPERRRRRSLAPGTLFVRHALAVAELHVRLREADRAKRFELLELTAEPACHRRFAGVGGQRLMLKPDSFVVVASGQWQDNFMVEIDRGTEGSRTLERQLRLYAAYYATGQEQAERGVFPRVLWLAPDARRVQVIVEAAASLPADTWQLFQVARFDEAIQTIAGDAKTTTKHRSVYGTTMLKSKALDKQEPVL
jgi:protein involved in plasmid replication-relaxation